MQPIIDDCDYYLAIDEMKSMITEGDLDSPEYHELRKEILRYQKNNETKSHSGTCLPRRDKPENKGNPLRTFGFYSYR